MKTLMSTLVMITTLANVSVAGVAQEPDKAPVKSSSQAPAAAEPATAPPTTPPPPPPAVLPKPPSEQPQGTSRQKPAEDGQWVYTEQYGWVWMPYGDKYTHLPPDGSTPNMYVYYPDAGWCWVVAPWLWGWGPMPYFGLWGPRVLRLVRGRAGPVVRFRRSLSTLWLGRSSLLGRGTMEWRQPFLRGLPGRRGLPRRQWVLPRIEPWVAPLGLHGN